MAIGNDLLEMIIRVCRMEAKYSPVNRVTVVRALRYKYTQTVHSKKVNWEGKARNRKVPQAAQQKQQQQTRR